MRDEIDGRMWAEHHDAFARNVAEFFTAARTALARLHALQWDAPWRRDGRLPKITRPGQA
ncbi:MAG TPA: hypothetical protein VF727_00655 [Allosphingosinicella sp.]|jgi:hypothetical protein